MSETAAPMWHVRYLFLSIMSLKCKKIRFSLISLLFSKCICLYHIITSVYVVNFSLSLKFSVGQLEQHNFNISIKKNLVWFLLGPENVDPTMFKLIACSVFGPARLEKEWEGGKDESSFLIFKTRFENLSPHTGNLMCF